jgi:hypothetical protein
MCRRFELREEETGLCEPYVRVADADGRLEVSAGGIAKPECTGGPGSVQLDGGRAHECRERKRSEDQRRLEASAFLG